MSETNQKYYRILPLILGLIAFLYFYRFKYVFENNNHFYENKINSKIVKKKNFENKSLQFFYDKNYCITTTNTKGDILRIGDSISKEKNSSEFKVFRKHNGNYNLYKLYDFKIK
ncbi:hypothetical protein MVI27_07355 [Chryseobacterium salipaludis]|uniref:hypothetical protein n=1 Tax=Chryseobacterium TaxID=59732 RepID=UPI001FF1822A|nr:MULTISPECIES: hypothetical protein [Chryseobacterium]MCJ8498074.1 hypothetical protein [Chryseobacterium salipaludis]MCX3296727.1 hypothetical protein [Planobacterium sp. JC490]